MSCYPSGATRPRPIMSAPILKMSGILIRSSGRGSRTPILKSVASKPRSRISDFGAFLSSPTTGISLGAKYPFAVASRSMLLAVCVCCQRLVISSSSQGTRNPASGISASSIHLYSSLSWSTRTRDAARSPSFIPSTVRMRASEGSLTSAALRRAVKKLRGVTILKPSARWPGIHVYVLPFRWSAPMYRPAI
jgi:hypothetical protein